MTRGGTMRRRGFLLGAAGAGAAATLARPARAATPVAIELFTSQGCAACPPADRLLGELAQDPSVVALAWHVDYWRGGGWSDPFALRLGSERHHAYADRLGAEIYTPALVAGGARLVIGYERDSVLAAMRTAPPASVPVALVPDGDGFAAQVGAAGQQVSALLALYQPEHVTDVSRGENGGRQLHEFRIVREAMFLGIWDGAPKRLKLPPVPDGLGAAVLVQATDLRVLGVGELRPTTS
jgi:hypothetical protein